MKHILCLLAIALPITFAQAADCVVHTTRYACPGQEQESYAKCNGKQSCDSTVAVTDENACASLALQGCANKRLTVTQYKSVTAKLAGKAVMGGVDFCDKDMGDYKVKENFPFRHAATCK